MTLKANVMTQILRHKNGLYWLLVFALVFIIMGAKGGRLLAHGLATQPTPTQPATVVVAQSPESSLPPSAPSTSAPLTSNPLTTSQPVVNDWRNVADAIATAPITNKATAFNLFIIFFV
ncbi:MAG TPA: hypothetical protein V6C65_31740, partial [Allocoleopsis sp.]